ncbi:MAG: hypothetical protein AB9922_04690 [Bacteroidales bacterium]
MRDKFFLTILILGFITCCIKDKVKHYNIPSDTIVSIINKPDSLLNDYIKDNEYTLLVFLDVSCSSCLVTLPAWGRFFLKYPRITPVIVLNTYNVVEFKLYIEKLYFPINYPIVSDSNNKIITLNQFDENYNALVIDSAKNVLYSGFPIRDDKFQLTYNIIYEL